MILQVFLSTPADNLLCALKIVSGAMGFIAFFKVRAYKRILTEHIKRDIENRKVEADVYNAQQTSIAKETESKPQS